MKFKRSNLKSTFKLGKFNIPEPVNDKNDVIPQLFFVPCLGFDLQGFRLGYGGGFFDRTLSQLKQKKKIISILAAFENQKTTFQFQDSFDEKVDYICTENNTYYT